MWGIITLDHHHTQKKIPGELETDRNKSRNSSQVRMDLTKERKPRWPIVRIMGDMAMKIMLAKRAITSRNSADPPRL